MAVQVADQEAAQEDQEIAQVDQEVAQVDQDSQVVQDSQGVQEIARAHKAATPMMNAPEMLMYATTTRAVSAPAPRISTAMGEVSATPPPAGV